VSTIDLSDGIRLARSKTVVDTGPPIMESNGATQMCDDAEPRSTASNKRGNFRIDLGPKDR
jgi:hypothetical protein